MCIWPRMTTALLRLQPRSTGASFYFSFSSANFGLGALDFAGAILMHKRTDYLLRLRPWSISTFLAALLAVALAYSMQEILASFGARLYFAGFFPAILIASLLGGAPAGIFAALVTIPIVWWAFMPPYFEFNPLTPADYDSFATFLLTSSLLIAFSQLYREALILLRNR